MAAAHVVLLIGVTLAVLAVAAFLISVSLILYKVFSQLVVILGAVEEVSERSQPAGPVIDDINRDLAASRQALEACVERLKERTTPAEASDEPGAYAAPVGSGSSAPASLGGWWKR